MFFASESPWWLTWKGRWEDAAKSARRFGGEGSVNAEETVSMMRRVIEMEALAKKPSHLELFKGTDFYRSSLVSTLHITLLVTLSPTKPSTSSSKLVLAHNRHSHSVWSHLRFRSSP